MDTQGKPTAFVDGEGRKWVFLVTGGSVRAVKKATGVNLFEAIEPKSTIIDQITSDPELFFEVVVCLLDRQLRDKGVTEEEFGDALNSEEVVVEASRQLIEAILDFFPVDRSRPLRRALGKLWEATERRAGTETARGIQSLEDLDFEAMAEKIVNPKE